MLMGVMGTNLAIWGLGTNILGSVSHPGLWWPGQHSWQAVPRTIPSCPICGAELCRVVSTQVQGSGCLRQGGFCWERLGAGLASFAVTQRSYNIAYHIPHLPPQRSMNRIVMCIYLYILYKPRLWISESSPIYIAEAETVSGQESEPTLVAQSKCDFGSRIDMKRGWEMMGTQYERNDSAIVSVANYNIWNLKHFFF